MCRPRTPVRPAAGGDDRARPPAAAEAARGRAEGLEPAPAYIGLGFSMRGEALCHHMFGTLASPGAFGNYGAGTSLFWIDPVRDITFTCLSAGVMEHNANMRRFQRIADIIHSAAL